MVLWRELAARGARGGNEQLDPRSRQGVPGPLRCRGCAPRRAAPHGLWVPARLPEPRQQPTPQRLSPLLPAAAV